MHVAPWLLILAITGCAQIAKLKSRVSGSLEPQRNVTFTPAPQPAKIPVPSSTSLADIVNHQLQRGHYAEGEKALRRYLSQHPQDRAAKSMLEQLVADPQQQLGSRWFPHQVRPGDSYSSLAARYLGDSGLFLILARYNGSTNPSILRAGEILHLPASGQRHAAAARTESSSTTGSAATAATTPSRHDAAAPSADAKPVGEAATIKAQRLQGESIALLQHAHKQQALAKLDQALTLDPQLKPVAAVASLRKQLVASYHQRAIVLYRDQHLNQAIALWDRVLAIEPKFEPAVIYRARALELKRRLKQL